MYKNHHISIIIPALNEEKSIGLVIDEIPKDSIDDIIVVDNGSYDATKEVAEHHGARVFLETRKGYGAACQCGLRHSTKTDIIVILDADHSDYPEQVTRLLNPIVENKADFVVGSRVLGDKEKGALSPQTVWGNRLAVFLIKRLFGFSFTDMGPFRAVRHESIKQLNLTDTNYGWNAEMQIKAIKKGLRIQEVPVDYRCRIGTSKISGTIIGVLSAGCKIIYTIFKYK